VTEDITGEGKLETTCVCWILWCAVWLVRNQQSRLNLETIIVTFRKVFRNRYRIT